MPARFPVLLVRPDDGRPEQPYALEQLAFVEAADACTSGVETSGIF